jgi:hypothetical protein
MRMRPLTHLLSFALLVCLIASTQTFAQSAIWQGAGTPGKFEDPNNWLGGTLPSSGNAAFIGLGDSGTITTEGTATIDTATGTVTTGTLSLGASTFTSAAGQDNGTLYIHGGALNIDGVAALGSNAALIIGGLGNSTLSTGGGSGTLIMDGGQINFSAVNAGIGMGFNASGEPDSTG